MNPQQTEVIINHLKEKRDNWIRNDTSEVPSCIEKRNALINRLEELNPRNPRSEYINEGLKMTNNLKAIVERTETSLMDHINQHRLSQTNSNTARDGYKEEQLVCDDLNSNQGLRDKLALFIGEPYDECHKLADMRGKIDISSGNKVLTAQVKKTQTGLWQQIDRHPVSKLIGHIPELESSEDFLRGLCEYPLLPDGIHIDRGRGIKKLSEDNYPGEMLPLFLENLNKNKRKMLEYALYGSGIPPKYLIGVEYINKQRTTIRIFEYPKVINYLEKLNFTIKPRKTVIMLGDHNAITLQRKGGDCGNKSANDLAFKVVVSALNEVEHLEYKL